MTLIPGDGIGPERLNHVRELFRLEDEARYKQTSPENTKEEFLYFCHSIIFTDSAVCQWILRLSGWIRLLPLRMTSIMRLLRSNVME